MILDEPPEELVKYLDVPGFARGDLYHIQKLVMTLQAYSSFGADTPGPDDPPREPSGQHLEGGYEFSDGR
jgi:hypothetical protein